MRHIDLFFSSIKFYVLAKFFDFFQFISKYVLFYHCFALTKSIMSNFINLSKPIGTSYSQYYVRTYSQTFWKYWKIYFLKSFNQSSLSRIVQIDVWSNSIITYSYSLFCQARLKFEVCVCMCVYVVLKISDYDKCLILGMGNALDISKWFHENNE